MSLDARQARYLERFYPGLIAQVSALGDGQFLAERPKPTPKGNGLCGISMRLTYRLTDGFEVQFRLTLKLRDGLPPPEFTAEPATDPQVVLADWELTHYALHYGKAYDACEFRFDRDDVNFYHVHMRPRPKEHVPCDQVTPDVRGLDPRHFVRMVALYRADKKNYPISKKKTP